MPFIACRTNTQQKLQSKTTKTRQPGHPRLIKGNRLLIHAATTPEKKPPACVPQDARVHYPIHKKPAHQPSNQRNRAGHHEGDPPPPKQQGLQRYCLTADASGLNSVPGLPLTPTRPGSTPTPEGAAPKRRPRKAGPERLGSTEVDQTCRSVVHRRFH